MTTATDLLVAQIAERIKPESIPTYRRDLVYVGYNDSLSDSDIEAILRDGYSESVDEWISDSQWEGASELADELFRDACDDIYVYDDLIGDWLVSDERSALILQIQELDTSDPYRDLLRNTSPILFRVPPQDEDHLQWLDAETLGGDPRGICEALGMSEDMLPAVAEIQPEIAGYAAEGGGYFGVAIVFRIYPTDLFGVADDALVTISNPFVWLTNPWAGNGYGVVAEDVTVTLKRSEIYTDKAAWGYGADDVFGGLLLDESDITVEAPATEYEDDE